MAEKTQDDAEEQVHLTQLQVLRTAFWKRLIDEMNGHTKLYENVSPTKEAWISGGSGLGGVALSLVVSKSMGRVEVYFSRSSKEENKFIFDTLFAKKEEIEAAYGDALTWERLDDKKASRIKHQLDGVNVMNKDDWDTIIAFMVHGMTRFEEIFRPRLAKINKRLKANA